MVEDRIDPAPSGKSRKMTHECQGSIRAVLVELDRLTKAQEIMVRRGWGVWPCCDGGWIANDGGDEDGECFDVGEQVRSDPADALIAAEEWMVADTPHAT